MVGLAFLLAMGCWRQPYKLLPILIAGTLSGLGFGLLIVLLPRDRITEPLEVLLGFMLWPGFVAWSLELLRAAEPSLHPYTAEDSSPWGTEPFDKVEVASSTSRPGK